MSSYQQSNIQALCCSSLTITLLLWLGLGSVHAQKESHFGQVALQPGASSVSGSIVGETGGTSSLAAISHYDSQSPRNLCAGYTQDITIPDHIVELEAPFEQLTLRIDSQGEDTTLVVDGPDGLYCGDDISDLDTDAQVTAVNLSRGTYRVWVGTAAPGEKYRYRLYLEE